MPSLTYADRELLLQTFDELKVTWEGTDSQLLSNSCDWARQLEPRFGYENALARDAAVLSRYLSDHHADQDVAEIARGGLLYLLAGVEKNTAPLADFGLLDEAFVSSYAVHEIRTRLGQSAAYNPPSLRSDEQNLAETQFLEFLDRRILPDSELIERALAVSKSLKGLAVTGLFRRLRRNIDFLAHVMREESHPKEHQAYARAAMSYFICEEDAIDDRLGIVGYLDDNFIAQLAVDLIEPSRTPWLQLLDSTVAAWPFLNGVILDDGTGPKSISEYMVINSALACRELRGDGFADTTLIVPTNGPVPFLLGLLSTLGHIHQSGQKPVSEESFRPGQKVLVDHCAIAEFAGFDTCNGRRMFKLRQYHTQQGHRLPCDRFWPLSDLNRLLPADQARVPRGQLHYDLGNSEIPLPALEFLFHANTSTDLAAVPQRTFVATPIAVASELARSVRLHGQPLKDVVPMGHLTLDGLKSWSTRFGNQEPLLIFASDLDDVCRYVEERRELETLVIVNREGRNEDKTASLQRMKHFQIPTLTVTPERAAHETPDKDTKGRIWEWTTDDFGSLLWPATGVSKTSEGVLASYEQRVQLRTSGKIEPHVIPCPIAEQILLGISDLRSHILTRGEEQLVDLDEILTLSYRLMTWFARCATPLSAVPGTSAKMADEIQRLGTLHANCQFLTEHERRTAVTIERLLQEFHSELQAKNPKAEVIQNLLIDQPHLTLIAPDARHQSDLQAFYGMRCGGIAAGASAETVLADGAVVPGWFRKDRMAALLVPPVASPLHLILYEVEETWYAGFRRQRKRMRSERIGTVDRSQLFPTVDGWRKPPLLKSESDAAQPSPAATELESIQEFVTNAHRQRAIHTARSDGTEREFQARLVLFEDGSHSFLTESRQVDVVTHLLETTWDTDDSKADVKRQAATSLKPGDAILFIRGSDRDVIRTAADQILPAGTRATSAIWREALVEYVEHERLSSHELHERLLAQGCPLHHATIQLWLENDDMIAPRAYKRDVALIAALTGNKRLAANLDTVLTSIGQVRNAHRRASRQLARTVAANAVRIIQTQDQRFSAVEVTEGVVVVRVLEMDDTCSTVRASICNRLLEGDSWHE